jgi:hypothetical protein
LNLGAVHLLNHHLGRVEIGYRVNILSPRMERKSQTNITNEYTFIILSDNNLFKSTKSNNNQAPLLQAY